MLAVRARLASLPKGVTWGEIYGAARLAGVGFTMSLFVGGLAFAHAAMAGEAKIGVLAASLLSGVWAFLVLSGVLGRGRRD